MIFDAHFSMWEGAHFFAKDLDFVSWDNCPVWGKPYVRHNAGFAADLMRGVKKKNFWIMEQTAGPGGWGSFGRNTRPGELRNIAYQQLAHGADGQIWFRWRTCTAGREQYWHGLLGHDGKALRRYKEAAQTAGEYHKLAPHLEGTTLRPQAAIIYDYDSLWATRIQPGFKNNDYHKNIDRYCESLFRAGAGTDAISIQDDFSAYRLILAPGLYVVPDWLADKVEEFVRKGGVFMTDMRAAVKDETSLCHERTLPGKLSGPLGITIEEYEAIDEGCDYSVSGCNGFTGDYAVIDYADWLKPTTARPLTRYGQPHMKQFSNLTRNEYGKGFGWYVGGPVKDPVFYDRAVNLMLEDARIKSPVKPPNGVEVTVRSNKKNAILFLINHLEENVTVPVPKNKTELLSGKKSEGKIVLEPFGVAIYKW